MIRDCRLLLAFLPLLTPAQAAAGEGNWLLGGQWVLKSLPCASTAGGSDIRPQGMAFTAEGLSVSAPKIALSRGDVKYRATYEIHGEEIVAHLDALSNNNHLDLTFRERPDGFARDANGYDYRRCAAPTQDAPIS